MSLNVLSLLQMVSLPRSWLVTTGSVTTGSEAFAPPVLQGARAPAAPGRLGCRAASCGSAARAAGLSPWRARGRPAPGAASSLAAGFGRSWDEIQFDGVDELEEEEEEPEPESNLSTSLVVQEPGAGLLQLQELWDEFLKTGEERELHEWDMVRLHKALQRDVASCPHVDTAAWVIHALEELEYEDDVTVEAYTQVLIDRSDELQAQSTLDAVISLGNLFWSDTDVLNALCLAVRRQLSDFTTEEVIRLSNSLVRMGGIDNTRNAGLFFEVQKRVNLPHVKEFLLEALNRDGRYYQEASEEVNQIMRALPPMPNKKLKDRLENYLEDEIAQARRASNDAARMFQERQAHKLEHFQEDLKAIKQAQEKRRLQEARDPDG
ncbi:unnamed protein product [Prorocentrum cordatum]|uniref:Uncharacterized protein n=1 Tax=Prorocentrum cordatum TaxID=2364126 RepID=A0ABN9RX95_9DINO|nr:unnamed protein product [Polarella glacialis]